MRGYQKLQVYEKSYGLVLEIYRETSTYPREEMYGITGQMRRAAASIPLNIAEGYAKRESQAEFKRYLMMAQGSSVEMSVLLDLSKDLGYMEEAKYTPLSTAYDEVRKMLHTLIKRVGSQI